MQSKISYYSLSKHGCKSCQNEDYVVLPTHKISQKQLAEKGYFFVLCDGLGGSIAGEVASRVCSRTIFEDFYSSSPKKNEQLEIINVIKAANNRILGVIQDFPKYKGMGTTLVSMMIHIDKVYINNVGDSRAYLWQPDKFQQISEDQSPAWENYQNGNVTKDELIECKYKNLLTEAIGIHIDPEILSYQMNLPENFTFLLCSDGLSDVCIDSDISEVIERSESLKDCANNLYNIAIEKGSIDDISIILVSNILT